MKVIANIIKTLLITALVAVVAIVGSFAAVFFMRREAPKEIFILDYALVFEKGEDEKLGIWFVKKTDCKSLANGDGVLYYDGNYCAANAMVETAGEAEFYSADDLSYNIAVDDENLVGRILASWQQK